MALAHLREAFHGKGLYKEAYETEIKWAAATQNLDLKDALEQGYEEAACAMILASRICYVG
jgi:hypothetical protein